MKIVVINSSDPEHNFAVEVAGSFDENNYTEKMNLFLKVQREMGIAHENFSLVQVYNGDFDDITLGLHTAYPAYSWVSWKDSN